MSWPSSAITTTNLDNGAVDAPSAARADILDMAQKVNTIIANGEPLTLAGGTLTGAVHEHAAAIALANIDVGSGSVFSKTVAANTTFTVSNVPSSPSVAAFVLELTNGGAFTVTWWSGVKWPGGYSPDLTAAGKDILGFYTRDGGTTWNGFMLGADCK